MVLALIVPRVRGVGGGGGGCGVGGTCERWQTGRSRRFTHNNNLLLLASFSLYATAKSFRLVKIPRGRAKWERKRTNNIVIICCAVPFIFFFSLGAEDGRRRDLADASASARVYETVLLGGPAIFKYLLCLRLLFLQRFKPDRPELFPLRFGTGLLAGRDPNRRWRLTAGRRRRRRSLLLLLLLLLLVVVSLRRAGLLARRPNT